MPRPSGRGLFTGSKNMNVCKKDHDRIKLLEKYFDEVNGYFYLIEMNLLLLEYEYTAESLYDYHSKDFDDPGEYIKH